MALCEARAVDHLPRLLQAKGMSGHHFEAFFNSYLACVWPLIQPAQRQPAGPAAQRLRVRDAREGG